MDFLTKLDTFLNEDAEKDAIKKFIIQGGRPEEVQVYVEKFRANKNKAKGMEKDIAAWAKKPFADFKEFVEILAGAKTHREKQRDILPILKTNSIDIVMPKSLEASCSLGANTKWCTAGREKNTFIEYVYDKGYALYYIIVKGGLDESLMRNDKFVYKYHGGDPDDPKENVPTARFLRGEEDLGETQTKIRKMYMKVPKAEYNRFAILVRRMTDEEREEQERDLEIRRRETGNPNLKAARTTQPFDIFDNYMNQKWFDAFMQKYNIPDNVFSLRTKKTKEGKYELPDK